MQVFLMDNRYFYMCELSVIESAFKKCICGMNSMKNVNSNKSSGSKSNGKKLYIMVDNK